MFDLRQERLDEIVEAEIEFQNHQEPEPKPTAPIVQPGFQLPTSVWALMIGCYVIFFGGMTALVAGSSFALFMVAISVLYAVVFFGMSSVLANLPGISWTSPLKRGEALPTWCGPMNRKAVYGQVLIVPAGIALFAVAVALIGAATA